jgi:hypothetical protein
MTKLPLPRINAFMLGKSASYRCNAYDDAAIAAEIINYIKTGQMPDGDTPICQRAANLIQQTPDDHKDQRLMVQAYTFYHLNGYADLMYSRFIEQLGLLDAPITHTVYGDYESSRIDLWFWIAPMFRKDISVARQYARETTGMELTLAYSEMLREVVRVQEANIAANHHTCQLLKRGEPTGHPKVDRLWELAHKVTHPKIFLRSAAGTQIAAGNWDRIVVWLLRGQFSKA